jgi:small subunit ribosomal protein S5
MAKKREKKELPEVALEEKFEQRIIDLARVTRVTAGGKKLRFRVALAIGNRDGKVGLGVKKGTDVAIAIEKALRMAQKNLIEVPIKDGTIPHWIREKYKAAEILLRPAAPGHGIIAGGPVRSILELAGYKNVTAKMLGSHNKIANARAVILALSKLKQVVK